MICTHNADNQNEKEREDKEVMNVIYDDMK